MRDMLRDFLTFVLLDAGFLLLLNNSACAEFNKTRLYRAFLS